MSPELDSILVTYYTWKMLSPLIIIGAFVIVFLFAILLDGLAKLKWWIQRKRLILRPIDIGSQERIVKSWSNGHWQYYARLEDLTWWERHVLLDERF